MGGRGSSSRIGKVSNAGLSSLDDANLKSYTTKTFKNEQKIARELKDLQKERYETNEKLKNLKSWNRIEPKYNARIEINKEKSSMLNEKVIKQTAKLKQAEKKSYKARQEWNKRFPNKSFLD